MSEREQFEAWVLSEGYPRERLKLRVSSYIDDHIDDLWSGWEARAARSQSSDFAANHLTPEQAAKGAE